MALSDYLEFLAPFLSCRDLCRLAQTCKDANTEAIEERVFGAHELVQVMNKAVIVARAALCVHIRSNGKRTLMSIPMPFGTSSKGKLRAVEQHRECCKGRDACVRVQLQEEFHHESKGLFPVIFTDELLFVTKSYTDNMIERFSHGGFFSIRKMHYKSGQ
jgi:hypothetical protein